MAENVTAVSLEHFSQKNNAKGIRSILSQLVHHLRVDRLSLVHTLVGSEDNIELLVQLLRRNIRHLTLKFVAFRKGDAQRVFRACSQLKSLCIDLAYKNDTKPLCDTLFMNSPIDTLTLTAGYNSSAVADFCDLIARKKTLRKLYLCDQTYEATISLCAAASQNTRIAELAILGSLCSFVEPVDLIVQGLGSLRRLSVGNANLNQLDFSGVELPSLTHLDLPGCSFLHSFRLGKNKTALQYLGLEHTNLSLQSFLDLLDDTDYNFRLREIKFSYYYFTTEYLKPFERVELKKALVKNTGPCFVMYDIHDFSKDMVKRNRNVNTMIRDDLGYTLFCVSLPLCSFFPPYVLLEIFYWVMALKAEEKAGDYKSVVVETMLNGDEVRQEGRDYRDVIETMLKRDEKRLVETIQRVSDSSFCFWQINRDE